MQFLILTTPPQPSFPATAVSSTQGLITLYAAWIFRCQTIPTHPTGILIL